MTQNTKITFYKYYLDTPLLPLTRTLYNIKNQFEEDYEEKEIHELFNFGDSLNTKAIVFSFDSKVKSSKNNNVQDLLACAFYLKSPNTFLNKKQINLTRDFLQKIKTQISKDVSRDIRFINNNEFIPQVDTNAADQFIQILVDSFIKMKMDVDYDAINKLSLASCQNVLNLINDQLILQMNKMTDNYCLFTEANKSIYTTITKSELNIKYEFNAKIVLGPGKSCGYLSYILLIDVFNNKYEFSSFKINYDLNVCLPEIKKKKFGIFGGYNRKTKKMKKYRKNTKTQKNKSI